MVSRVLLTVLRGFAMGAADIVPGVSGGTIALVLGIYERFVASVRAGSSALGNLIKGDLVGFRRWMGEVEWTFVISLGAGIGLAVVTLSHLIESLLDTEAVIMSAVFLGLVAGSVVIASHLIRAPKLVHVTIIAAVGVVVFFLLGFIGGTSEDAVSQVSDPAMLAFFVAGAIAICAMILPGVSGSFLLVIMGMYSALLAAVTDADVLSLGVFVLGAIVGLALFSQVLHWLLQHHHDVVLACLIGLMAGSVRVLWPWPDGVFTIELGTPDTDVLAAAIAGVVAFVAVYWIASIAQRFEAAEEASLADDSS